MTTPWGNDDRGPGGEQSWLGGSGRNGHEVTPGGPQGGASGAAQDGSGSSGGWSSDFAADSGNDGAAADQGRAQDRAPDPSDPSDLSARDYQGPQFGQGGGQGEGDDSGGASNGQGAGRSSEGSSGIGKKPAVRGAVVTVIALVVIAVIAYRTGTQVWWMVFFVGVPLIRRLVRLLGRGTRR